MRNYVVRANSLDKRGEHEHVKLQACSPRKMQLKFMTWSSYRASGIRFTDVLSTVLHQPKLLHRKSYRGNLIPFALVWLYSILPDAHKCFCISVVGSALLSPFRGTSQCALIENASEIHLAGLINQGMYESKRQSKVNIHTDIYTKVVYLCSNNNCNCQNCCIGPPAPQTSPRPPATTEPTSTTNAPPEPSSSILYSG